MKINKIYSAISVALFATALTACSSFQEDDLFDESVSLHITKFNEDLRRVWLSKAAKVSMVGLSSTSLVPSSRATTSSVVSSQNILKNQCFKKDK